MDIEVAGVTVGAEAGELMQKFNSEQECADVLYAVKWPNGFRCSRCGHDHAYKITTRRLPLLECSACHYQESLTTGTVMEGSKSNLRKWFQALILVSSESCGINAVQLSEAINVTYKTAWLILHKLRHAMGQADGRMLLSGIVQINSAMYGRPHNPTIQRHKQEHPLLVAASVNTEGEPVYLKIKQVAEKFLLEKSVRPNGAETFIVQHVEPSAIDVACITARFSSRRFHKLIGAAKEASRWINMMFHGIGPKYLQAYLDEYCFRSNTSNQGESLFVLLARLCAATAVVTRTFLKRRPTVA